MTTAKRRTGNSATFVADSNHHYTPLEQQPIQQQQQHQLQHQQQQEHQNHQLITHQQQQQQYSNHHHHHQQHSNQNQHENQRLLPAEPSSSLSSSTTVSSSSPLLLSSSSSQHYRQQSSAATTATQRRPHHHHHYTNYNSTACTRLSQSSASAAQTTAATANAVSNSSASASSSSSSSSSATASIMRGECSVKLPLDILWLPKSAMRPVGPDTSHTDCILVVGVSRPKLAVVFLTVMLISLFLTFHVLYDSAVYNIQAAQAVHEHHHHHQRLALISSNSIGSNGIGGIGNGAGNAIGSSNTGSFNNLFNTNRANHMPADYGIAGGGGSAGGNGNNKHGSDISSSNQQISHPMVFPSNRVHFPKTSRRLPQALIIGIRKCGTRALLEMLYLHPRIQKAGGEVHFFDRDENYMKGLEWYRKKMPHSFRGQITIEKSPSYFVSPEVPERVRAMNASIKLLLIVREPVTRAISDYTQLRSHAATATLPLAAVEQQSPTSAAAAAAASSASLLSAKVSSSSSSGHSMLYNKLNAGFSSSQQYDNSLGGGGGGSGSGNGGGGTIGTATAGRIINSNSIYSPGGAGAVKTNVKNPYNSHRQYETTTTTTASTQTNMASSTAQILSKSFEELAIFPNGTVNESYRPLSISMYHLHLHRWLEVFPREQILIVNGDRLIDDPVSQLKKIETFLGIEHRITGNHFYFNETKGFYCLRYDSGDRCLRETKGRKHPHVDPLVISKLRKFFAEHNQRFYELVGEDLGWPEE